MKHFIIARFTIENNFHIIPITDNARNLVAQWASIGDELIFPTFVIAQGAANGLDRAIENYPNRLSTVLQETSYGLS